MAEVTVDERSNGSYTVVVTDGKTRTTHTVRVPAGLAGRLGCGSIPVTELVRCSFTFLLAWEPATSILREFSLEQISDYFPDYPEKIRRMVTADAGDDSDTAL